MKIENHQNRAALMRGCLSPFVVAMFLHQ